MQIIIIIYKYTKSAQQGGHVSALQKKRFKKMCIFFGGAKKVLFSNTFLKGKSSDDLKHERGKKRIGRINFKFQGETDLVLLNQ